MAIKGQGVRLPLFSVFMLFGVSALPLSADTVLKVDDAVKIAIEKNLSLQRTSWTLDAKKRQADNALGVLIPSTSLTAGMTRYNQAVTATGTYQPNTIWTYSESMGVSLSLSASIFAKLDEVKLNYESGQLTYDLAKRTLEKNVRLSYASLLLEQENLKLTRENLARKEKSLADTQTQYKNGLASDLDVLTAQVSVETLKPTIQQLEATHLNDLGQFKVLLGIPVSETIQLEGTLDVDLEKDLNLDGVQSGTSPDIRQAQLTLQSNQLALDSSRWSVWVPSLTVGWTSAPYYQLTSGAQWIDASGALSVQLSYSLDSFLPWTTSRETQIEAEEAVRTSQNQLEETKTSSALTRENDYRLIRQAVESLKTQALNVELAQKTYDLSQQAYQRGTKDLLSLQNSEGDLSQARYDLLSERYTLISTVLALEYELDVPFGTLLGGKK